MDLHSLSAYHYDLPEELIAQYPSPLRDSSRLMIVNRLDGSIKEIVFRDLPMYLESGDSLIFNDTKVLPARLIGKRESGGETEILLLEQKRKNVWDALARPGRKLRPGSRVSFSTNFFCTVLEIGREGIVTVEFGETDLFFSQLEMHGQMPLPHYIKRSPEKSIDPERYQTVYAKTPGAAAAPTAGLHFTNEVLQQLSNQGISQFHVTLHVGLGTFKPVVENDIREHPMHSENFYIPEETAEQLNAFSARKKKICVGTTSCRALESSSNGEGIISPGYGATNLFIYPGYNFKATQALITNFHLPGSTLLMLVSAFAGYDLTMEAYRKAVKDRFRFFSYGDAMLIV